MQAAHCRAAALWCMLAWASSAEDGCPCMLALSPKPCACHAVGMEDMNQFSATTPPDSKDPNAPWYHMNVNGTGEHRAATWGALHATVSTAVHA